MSYSLAEAIKVAKSQIGKRETGNNDTPYNRALGKIPGYPHGGYGYPWCMSFEAWVADRAGGKANVDYPRTAGCEVAVAWFKAHKRYGKTPHVGDMVFYGPGGGTHVELVVAVSKTAITTVGGNTSGSLNGAFHNGDGVYQKSVSRTSPRIHGYGSPAYDAAASQEEDDMEPSTKFKISKYWQDRGEFSHETYDAGFLWTGAVSETRTYGKKILAKLDAQQVTINKLVDLIATGGGLSQAAVDAFKAELREEIDGIVVRFDTEEST